MRCLTEQKKIMRSREHKNAKEMLWQHLFFKVKIIIFFHFARLPQGKNVYEMRSLVSYHLASFCLIFHPRKL